MPYPKEGKGQLAQPRKLRHADVDERDRADSYSHKHVIRHMFEWLMGLADDVEAQERARAFVRDRVDQVAARIADYI